jgi:hypothetical protein
MLHRSPDSWVALTASSSPAICWTCVILPLWSGRFTSLAFVASIWAGSPNPLRDAIRDHALTLARASGLKIEFVQRRNFRKENRVAEVCGVGKDRTSAETERGAGGFQRVAAGGDSWRLLPQLCAVGLRDER